MDRAGEYVPSTTYFNEREERLLKEIKAAQDEIDIAKDGFAERHSDLIVKRDEILVTTARLRNERAALEAHSKEGREAIREFSSLVLHCEILTQELTEFLRAPEAQIATLDAEIASLEDQQRRKTAKPAKAVEKLQERISRLKLRRTLADKQRLLASPVVIQGERAPEEEISDVLAEQLRDEGAGVEAEGEI